MPDLKQSLLGQDHGHLRIIGEHWGISLTVSDAQGVLNELVDKLLDPDLINEIIDALPENSALALRVLHNEGGRMPWSQFTRRFGNVREVGPGRRDRERPDRSPISSTEILWYRGLVGRAFFETNRGPEEYAYIPSDLMEFIPKTSSGKEGSTEGAPLMLLGRAATAQERAHPIPATDRILDHTCTLLAGLRAGVEIPSLDPYSIDFIHALIELADILDPDGTPNPKRTRNFLESPRGVGLTNLAQTWLNTPDYNDLHHVSDLQPEGEWQNDPLETRRFILRLLSVIPKNSWWNLSAFITDIHKHFPDYQRPAGDYDSWFIRNRQTGDFLRGFEHWNAVDGALIRHIITRPLHWLGIMDLASPDEDAPVAAFRFSRWAESILAGQIPKGLPEEKDQIHVRSDGRVSVPNLALRTIRYQLARFCQWEEGNVHEYRYRLTPASLSKAREGGLRISHLISLLQRHAASIPPNIFTALNRWDAYGTEVRLQEVTILRLGSPKILQKLRSSHAARFLGDPLGPTTIVVKPGAGEKVLAILTEMGHFGEIIGDG